MSVLLRLAGLPLLTILLVLGYGRAEWLTGAGTTAWAGEPGQAARQAAPGTQSQPARKSQLLIRLPQGCNTPDAMALLADGSVILSMPNFNNLKEGARLMRITSAQPRGDVSRAAGPSCHGQAGRAAGCVRGALGRSVPGRLPDDRPTAVARAENRDEKWAALRDRTGGHRSARGQCRAVPRRLPVRQRDADRPAGSARAPVASSAFRWTSWHKAPSRLADNETEDPHLLGIITVHNPQLQLGADGLCFDKQGNLYIGNFADGTVHRMQFDKQGKVQVERRLSPRPIS